MKRTVLLVFSLLLAMSCERGDLYSTFSTRNKVFFSCDTSKSPYNQLSTPGRFLSVRKSDGKLYMVDSDGNKYEETLSEIQNGSFLLGMLRCNRNIFRE